MIRSDPGNWTGAVGALASRLIAQKTSERRNKHPQEDSTLVAVVATLVGGFKGARQNACPDLVTREKPQTIC